MILGVVASGVKVLGPHLVALWARDLEPWPRPVSPYLLGVADKVSLVEVERVAAAQLTIDHLPLPVYPTLWGVMPPLKHDVVALQPAGKVVPSRGH